MTRPWFWPRRSARLARYLPSASVGMACGDLLEEFEERYAKAGRLRAEWWLALELASVYRAYKGSAMVSRPRRPPTALLQASDLRQAARILRRSPWYAATASGVMGLGLALGITVFAIVDGALFKPLPYPQADRLFTPIFGFSRLPQETRLFPAISPATLDAWRHAVPEAQITAYNSSLQTIGTHEMVRSARVDAAFFDVVGIPPAMGGFTDADFGPPTKIRPAILTDRLWRERFGGDRAVMGRTFFDEQETGEGIRVVGILPPEFVFPYPDSLAYTPRLLTPLPPAPPGSNGASLKALFRLPPGASSAAVSSAVKAQVAAEALSRPVPRSSTDGSERSRILREGYDTGALVALQAAITDRLRASSWAAFGAASTLLLLACFNVTGLMIARVRERWRELAVRRSLGASRLDLIRLLAAESVLIVGSGAAFGMVLAGLFLPLTTRFLTGSLLVLKPAAIDGRVAVYALLASIACVLLTTVFAARAAAQTGLRTAAAEGAGATRRARGSRAVLAIEIALAFIVAVSGALVSGSLLRVWKEDPGFDVRHTALVAMSTPRGASADDINRLLTDLQHIPGVVSAGGVGHALLERAFNGNAFDQPTGIADPAETGGPGRLPIESIPVTRGYFAAAGLQPTDGRVPTDEELSAGAPVVAVSKRVARLYWPGRRALGETLLNKGRGFTVVGVVPDARFMSLDTDPQGEIYWSVAAMPKPSISNVLLRLTPGTSPQTVATSIIRGCPDCWVRSAQTLDSALGVTIAQRQFSAWLFSAFGIAALVTVGTGILGLVAMTTRRRTREIGIRMAIGATPTAVLRQIVGEQLRAVAIGLLIGAIAATWLTGFLTGYLYKTTVYDVRSWAAAIVALFVVALIAAVIPSRQASRIDPVRALRAD